MSDVRDGEDPRDAWEALVAMGERYPGTGMAELSERLRQGGPPPAPLRGSPLILDTDIGGDGDDAVAVAVAALRVPELALVITTDEHGGERARFARHFLDLLGRPDVPVVAGADLGNTRLYFVDGLFPDTVPAQPTDVLSPVVEVCERTDRPVRWVGMGPMTNLAGVLDRRPDLAERFVLSQMGGAFQYRKPDQAEHNFRIDPGAAARVLASVRQISLVISDVTFNDEMEISADTPLYRRLAAADAPEWAAVLTTHLDRWFASVHRSTLQHDGLTLSAALEYPFVDFDVERVALDGIGRMRRDVGGITAHVSRSARYPAFMRWLERQLDVATGPVPLANG